MMMKSIIVWILFLCLAHVVVVVVVAQPNTMLGVHPLARAYWNRLQQQRIENNHVVSFSHKVEPEYFTQQLDHFNALDTRTYSQRFFVNDDYFLPDTNDSPVFLFVGGEGSESPLDVEYGHHIEMAQTHHALVISLEHRYYGASVPVPDLTTPNMRYLSSQQALADLATFHGYAVKRWNLTSSSNKWITFGGSYPGALSSWARLKYPHLIHASVASSAPVQAIVDFTGYNQVVSKSLSTPLVGGSEACLANVHMAFQQIRHLLDLENDVGLREIERRFHSCTTLKGERDIETLVSNLAGIFQGTVQYNRAYSSINIERICNIMTGKTPGRRRQMIRKGVASSSSTPNSSSSPTTTPLDRLETLSRLMFGTEDCVDFSYDAAFEELNNTVVFPNATGAGMRQWIYQTCSQFGYYQTCEPTQAPCPFLEDMSLSSFTDLCWDLFGIASSQIDDSIAFSNAYYGGIDPQSTTGRVLFVNGKVDPWHVLGIYNHSTNPDGFETVLIDGASHCQDMGRKRFDDSIYLQKARAKIETVVASWLEQQQKDNEQDENTDDNDKNSGTILPA